MKPFLEGLLAGYGIAIPVGGIKPIPERYVQDKEGTASAPRKCGIVLVAMGAYRLWLIHG